MRTLWSSLKRARPSLFNTVSMSRKKVIVNCNVHERYEDNKKKLQISSSPPGESCDRKYVTTATATANVMLREPPEPKGLPVFGTIFELLTTGGAKTLHEYVDRRHKELGPIYKERIGPITTIFVNSPQEYRRIFRLEGPTPKHYLPESWLLYNELRSLRRGLIFMYVNFKIMFNNYINTMIIFNYINL